MNQTNNEQPTERYLTASANKGENDWFTFYGYDLFESARQEYAGNNCIFAAGLVSPESADPACDTTYLVMEKDGQDAKLFVLRPDEMAAISQITAGALWSKLIGELDGEDE